MPLHLLGKKSWNVYNPENIARVRRDEAQAKAREEEEERRMQEADAQRRIQILRGERPPTPPPPPRSPSPSSHADKKGHHALGVERTRKRRRLAGENDTDRDIRYAREDAELALAKRDKVAAARTSDAPLLDDSGHINLFPEEPKPKSKRVEKNAETEKEKADKERSLEDQYTLRFSNAAGFRQSVHQRPWYSSSKDGSGDPESAPGKDVWGNEDPMRRERERSRMDASDPLAAMRKGVRQLKTVQSERKKWNEERARELEALKAEERRQSYSRRKRSPSVDSLEGFDLDASPQRKDNDHRSHRHHRHHRDSSRDRSHRRHSSSRSLSKTHSSRHDRHHGRSDDRRRSHEHRRRHRART